jgi:ABC-2 type transport system ATP-binding protein
MVLHRARTAEATEEVPGGPAHHVASAHRPTLPHRQLRNSLLHNWPGARSSSVQSLRNRYCSAGYVGGMTLGDAAAEPLVHIKDFRMDFGARTVIKDLSFDVRAGETFGFLGSNGSGRPRRCGRCWGLPADRRDPPHRRQTLRLARSARLGYLPEERCLYKKESVLDVMVYFGRLKGLDKAKTKAWSLDYLERVELADKANMRLDKLSGGQQQKKQLGVTIMSDPELLTLDEPTKGFDPVNRRLLMEIIEEQKFTGAT